MRECSVVQPEERIPIIGSRFSLFDVDQYSKDLNTNVVEISHITARMVP